MAAEWARWRSAGERSCSTPISALRKSTGLISRSPVLFTSNAYADSSALISIRCWLARAGCSPVIRPFTTSASRRPPDGLFADPCIVHLHGQGYGPIMLNSEEETQEHAQKLRPLIDDTFSKFPLIVVGYSGEADKVFEQIVAAYSGKYRLYWLGFEEEPKGHLRALAGRRSQELCPLLRRGRRRRDLDRVGAEARLFSAEGVLRSRRPSVRGADRNC